MKRLAVTLLVSFTALFSGSLTIVLAADEMTETTLNDTLHETDRAYFGKELVWLRRHVADATVSCAKFDAPIRMVRSRVASHTLTLLELGTNEKELAELISRHKKVVGTREGINSARECVLDMRERARNPSALWNFYEAQVYIVRLSVASRSCTLLELDTNEKELAGFVRLGKKIRGKE